MQCSTVHETAVVVVLAATLGACEYFVKAALIEDVPDETQEDTMIHLDDGSVVFVDKPKEEVAAVLNEGPYGRALLREVDVGVYVVPNRVTALE